MNSYEIVKRAIEFEKPERLPTQFNAFEVNDTYGVNTKQIGTGDNTKRETYDEWGCLWVRTEVSNMGQVRENPLKDWTALKNYHWPDANDPAFYEGMNESLKNAGDKYILTDLFMLLFERMYTLRGMENVLVDLYLDKNRIEMLADRIVEYDITVIKNISNRFPGKIHGFSFTDDWGTERACFISRKLWQDFFKPRYARIFDAVHSAGWHVWMHSCGKVNEIIEDLIEIGLNVINLQQPRTLGIEEIGNRYRGRICFSSLCDIQKTLPSNDKEKVDEEAHALMEYWATPKGGFILSDYGDDAAIGVTNPEIKLHMYNCFSRHSEKLYGNPLQEAKI